jgi:hypothetical protein
MLPGYSPADYGIGADVSQMGGGAGGDRAFANLLNQLLLNDQNRHGPPPSSTSAISSLPDVPITPEVLGKNILYEWILITM